MATINKPCVYFLPAYAPGHLISMVELAKNLLQCKSTSSNSFSINILLIQPDKPENVSPLCSSYLQSIQAQNLPIQFHPLPFVEPPHRFNSVEEFVTIYMQSYSPHIKAALSASPSPVSGLVVDMFASDVIDVANELNIPSYIYFSSTATLLSLLFHLPSLQGKNDEIDFSEVEEDICVPGLAPIPSKSMPNPLMNTKSSSCKSLMYHAQRFKEAKGVILNSNIHIEEKAVKAVAQGSMLPQMHPIGPIILFDENKSQEHECLKWLDGQPSKSVVFLCFGSLGAFEASQVQQIAIALEQSGHRFLWVLRTPSKDMLR